MRFALLALTLWCGGCAWLYPAADRADETRFVETRDGRQLALYHYRPRRPERSASSPVLVCHGISSNRFNWDLGAVSFPIWLAERGHDVWLVELRGAGRSHPAQKAQGPQYGYTFDDHVLLDAPAAVDFASAQSPTGMVHWVGHSMGGLVGYGYLQRVGQERVRSIVTLGSPPYVFDHSPLVGSGVALWPAIDRAYERLPTTRVSGFAPLAWPSWFPPLHLVWNDRNMEPAVARLAAANAISDVSSHVVDQLVRSRSQRALLSFDRRYDYTAGLERITVPALLVAGVLDHLAPPVVVAQAFHRIRSAEKRLEIVGRANGFSADYGHVDLALGKRAAEEVYPVLGAWIEEHE